MTSDGERSRLGCCSTRPRVEPFLICRAGAPARTREARVFPTSKKTHPWFPGDSRTARLSFCSSRRSCANRLPAYARNDSKPRFVSISASSVVEEEPVKLVKSLAAREMIGRTEIKMNRGQTTTCKLIL